MPTPARMLILLSIVAMAWAAGPAHAEQACAHRTAVISADSRILGETIPVSVYLPPSYGDEFRRFPCLYILEDDLYHRAMTGMVDTWVRLGLMPEVIVIGVPTSDRWRDYTPTRAGVPGGEIIATSGGGADHRAFLTDELIPRIEAGYRTGSFRVLVGHSIAGLQVVSTFLANPELFGAYVATSPSFWWDDEWATAQCRQRRDGEAPLAGALFLAMGNEDETMQAPFRRFVGAIEDAQSPEFRWTSRSYPTATHPQVPAKAFGDALDFVFTGWELPASAMQSGIEAVEAHYGELSARFGYRVEIPEHIMNRLGYRALGEGRLDDAIDLFRRNAAAYPASANVHDSLGEAYLKSGDLERARRQYEQALELDPGLHSARSALEQIAEAG